MIQYLLNWILDLCTSTRRMHSHTPNPRLVEVLDQQQTDMEVEGANNQQPNSEELVYGENAVLSLARGRTGSSQGFALAHAHSVASLPIQHNACMHQRIVCEHEGGAHSVYREGSVQARGVLTLFWLSSHNLHFITRRGSTHCCHSLKLSAHSYVTVLGMLYAPPLFHSCFKTHVFCSFTFHSC